ncbi:MAG: carboxypeptidase-like regulatory domain-containing protein, partial [candidate division WOR-3 bacterium]
MFKKNYLFGIILLLVLLFSVNVFAGVTGKITGRVIDKQTKEGIPGVNVIIPELGIGAVTDLDGYYFI